MSREVDQRVVAMYFDNKDFQKKAQATIKTLGDLKSNLDIEKSVKGFDTLKKATESLKLDEVSTKVKHLKDGFQGLGNVVSKAFEIGTGPLRSIENLFSTFQGYVTKFIGFDLAGKLVGGIENAVRELTIAPVSAGWSEYELKMDSIKTIMSGSGESLEVVTEKLQELNHYADQTVYSFSDMTSNIGKFTNNKVALDDATTAMKGIANATADAGQGAQQASMAMYNISQAIGVGSMKMIDWKSLENANIATVKLKDTFIQAGVASGKLVKKVTKDAKTGEEVTKYYVKGFEKGKKAVEVTAENFRETLNKDWLDKDTMLKVFSIYSGELDSIEDVRKLGFTEALGFTDEDIQKFLDIGDNAMAAATEVRTFTKMFDALKEAAQSGWAETLELIFGNMEEATELWTTLNDKISEFLDKSSEARNTVFGEWRGMYRDKEGNLRQTEDMYETVYEPLSEEERNNVMGRIADVDEKISESEEKIKMWNDLLADKKLSPDKRKAYTSFIEATQATIDDYKSQRLALETELLGHPVQKQIMEKQEDGRKVLIDSFFELLDILGDIGHAFTEAWESVFGKFDSKTLWAITNGFRDFTKNLRNWLGTSDKAGSRLNKITTGLKGVFSVVKLAVNIFKSGINLVSKIAQPIAEKAIDIFEKFGKVFEGIGDKNLGDAIRQIGSGISALWQKITSLSWSDITKKFGEIWDSTKKTIADWLTENGLGDVVTTLSEWKASLKQKWDEVAKWFEESGIGQFFTDAWGWITTQFKPTTYTDVDEKGNKVTVTGKSPFEQTLNNIWEGIKSVWATVVGWGGWQSISKFLTNTWGWITGLFRPTTQRDDHAKGNTIYSSTARSKSPIAQFLSDAWESIKGVWKTLTEWPGWNAISTFLTNTWDWITSWFKPTMHRDDHAQGNTIYTTAGSKSPIAQFLSDAWESIKGVWATVTGWGGWKQISNFLTNTWYWITSWFKPTTQRDDHAKGNTIYSSTAGSKSPVGQFLSDAWETIKDVWAKVTGWEGWEAIGQFFTNTWDWIVGLVNGSSDGDAAKETTKVAKEAEGETEAVGILTTVLNALGEFWEKITGFATQVAQVTGADKFIDTVFKMVEIIGTIVTSLVDIVHGAVVEGDWGDRLKLFGIILGGIVTNILSTRVRVLLAKGAENTEGAGEMVMKIALGLLLIAGAVSLLGAQPEENLKKGLTAMLAIAGIVSLTAVVIGLVRKFLMPPVEEQETSAWERLGSKLITIIGIVGSISTSLALLPGVITAMGNSKISGDDVAKVLLSLAGMITAVSIVIGVVTAITGGNAKGIIMTSLGIVGAIAILLAGLEATFAGIGWLVDLGGVDLLIQKIEATGKVMAAVGEAIGKFVGGFSRGRSGEKDKKSVDEAAENVENMNKLAEATESFTPDKMIGLTRMMDAVDKLVEAAPAPGSWNRIQKFNDELPKLGGALAQFSMGFSSAFKEAGGDPTEGLDQATKQIGYIKTLMESMQEFNGFFKFKTDMPWWSAHPEGLINEVDPDTFGTLGEMYAKAAMALVTAVKKGLDEGQIEELSTVFDATPIVDSIVIALGLGETAIADAVHKMVQAGLDASGGEPYTWTPPTVEGDETNPLSQLMTLFQGGEGGGLDANTLFSTLFGGFDVNTFMGLAEDKFGGIGEQLEGIFSFGSFEDMMGNFFPINENGELDVDSILGDWQENMEAIDQALEQDGDNQIVLRPVFDMEELEFGVEQINDYFRKNPITASLQTGLPDMTINVDTTQIVDAIDDVKISVQDLIRRLSDENSDNIGAISSLSGDIYEVARAIRAMRIYLDTGVLAGAVDEELGLQAILAGRTG